MPTEKSAGVIVFHRGHDLNYLLLHYEAGHWEFPRGNIEAKETAQEAAQRELAEETGIRRMNLVPGFEEKVSWFYMRDGRRIFKEATFFLAETAQKQVKISGEHIGYAWLSYGNAMKKLTFRNAQSVLEKAHQRLLGIHA